MVEYILQPLAHKIKNASARSSHRCPLPCPLLPLHSMLKVAKLFPFVGGAIQHMFISTTLIPGVIGDCLLPCVCYLFVHKLLFKSCKICSSHRPRSTSVSRLYLLGAKFLLWSALRGFLCPGPFGGRGVPGVIGGRHWGVTSALALSGGGGFQGLSGGLSCTLGLIPLRTYILLKIRTFVFLPPSPFYVRLSALYRL